MAGLRWRGFSRDLNHHRNRHTRPEFPTPTAYHIPQTPRSDGPAPDFAGTMASVHFGTADAVHDARQVTRRSPHRTCCGDG